MYFPLKYLITEDRSVGTSSTCRSIILSNIEQRASYMQTNNFLMKYSASLTIILIRIMSKTLDYHTSQFGKLQNTKQVIMQPNQHHKYAYSTDSLNRYA